jgi:signal peptidase II
MTSRSARVLLFSTAFCIYIADRIAKLVVLKAMSVGGSIKVIPNIFHITLVFNNGAAFGLLKGRAVFFVIVSAFVVTFIILLAWRHKGMSGVLAVSLGFILGGALGNLVDRLTFGYVIDFFDFRVWPVFNVADSAITTGVGLLALSMLMRRGSHASGTV